MQGEHPQSTAQAAAAPPGGQPRLVLPTGGMIAYGGAASRGQIEELALPVGRLVVGRARTADLRLKGVTLSMEHAELEVAADGKVVVRDLGSENGVRVDGVPVAEAELHDGNRLQLGDVQLVYKTDLGGGPGGRQGGEFD